MSLEAPKPVISTSIVDSDDVNDDDDDDDCYFAPIWGSVSSTMRVKICHQEPENMFWDAEKTPEYLSPVVRKKAQTPWMIEVLIGVNVMLQYRAFCCTKLWTSPLTAFVISIAQHQMGSISTVHKLSSKEKKLDGAGIRARAAGGKQECFPCATKPPTGSGLRCKRIETLV